jgi:NAD(P)-dependent dehydrogenase (short-subunit alcohol dehydrogenase family)
MTRDPTDAFRLDDRVAIVTGASSGIGVRFAHVLAGAGAKVALAARRIERLEKLAAELPGSGHLAISCDMADDADIAALVRTTIDRHGRIDVLVNNAGTSDPQPAETEPLETFRRLIDVNLTAAFELTQLAARHMLARGEGTVVNVASVLGTVASGQIPQASYTASKGGLVNLTRELAVQWARRGIRVNALCPGWFPTEMTDAMFEDEGGLRWIRRNTPMGRAGELHELDGALLFLASEASSYVTGAVLMVDGGWTAR